MTAQGVIGKAIFLAEDPCGRMGRNVKKRYDRRHSLRAAAEIGTWIHRFGIRRRGIMPRMVLLEDLVRLHGLLRGAGVKCGVRNDNNGKQTTYHQSQPIRWCWKNANSENVPG